MLRISISLYCWVPWFIDYFSSTFMKSHRAWEIALRFILRGFMPLLIKSIYIYISGDYSSFSSFSSPSTTKILRRIVEITQETCIDDTFTISSSWLSYVWMTAWFSVHCWNHHSNSHTHHVIIQWIYLQMSQKIFLVWWLCGRWE